MNIDNVIKTEILGYLEDIDNILFKFVSNYRDEEMRQRILQRIKCIKSLMQVK